MGERVRNGKGGWRLGWPSSSSERAEVEMEVLGVRLWKGMWLACMFVGGRAGGLLDGV